MMHITVAGTDIDYEMSWAKVQRRVAQLIKDDRFYTQEEYDRLDDVDPIAIRETLAERGIVNGELVDPEALDRDPFIQQVVADAQQIASADAPARFSLRVIPFEAGMIGIWDSSIQKYYGEGGVLVRHARQDEAAEYLANLQSIYNLPRELVCTTANNVEYRIGDSVRASFDDSSVVMVIDHGCYIFMPMSLAL